MAKTETHQEPTPEELANAGDGERHHPGDIVGEPHGVDDHGETHGHDDHAHPSEQLGPVDSAAWAAFAVGIAAGLLVALVLAFSLALTGAPAAV